MKHKKALKISLGVIVALFLFIICTVLFWLGPTVKMVVQRIGPKALGTDVKIDKLSINPRKGIIHLSGFTIANPQDFAASNSVSLASLDIAIDMASLFSQTVMVNQVQINSPHFVFEQSEASDNIAEYIHSVQNFIGYTANAPIDPDKAEKKLKKEEKKAQKKAGKEPVTVIVDSLEINDIQFHLTNTDNPALDIAVGLDRLAVSMTNGVVELDNLQVNNPRSLATKDLFSLEKINIRLDPDTIYNAPLKILDTDIINPHFFVEWAYDADTISEFLAITDATIQRVQEWPLPKRTSEPPKDTVRSGEQAPPPEIYDVTVTNLQFHLVHSVHPKQTMKVQLDVLHADMSNGRIDLNNFYITNPTRLATPNLFSLESISLDIDPPSFYEKTVTINDLSIGKPHLFLESNPETDTVKELMKISETITGSLPTNTLAAANPTHEGNPTQPDKPEQPPTPPLALHNLSIEDIQVKFLDSTGSNAPIHPRMLAGIGSISVKLVEGKIRIEGITIPNTPGFEAKNMFHLDNIRIDLDPETLFTDHMVISRILVDTPIVNLEQTKDSGNVAALQKSLAVLAPPPADGATAESTSAPVTAAPGEATARPVTLADQPVILEQLLVTNMSVNLTLPPTTNSLTGKAMSYLNPLNYMPEMEKQAVATNTTAIADNNLELIGIGLITLKPLEGILQLDNMKISNPPGFSDRKLIKIDTFHVDLDENTLFSDTLVVADILISKPNIRYERQVRSDNIKALQTEIETAAVHRQEYMATPQDTQTTNTAVAAGNAAPETADDAESQKVIISHLLIKDGIVRAKLSALPSIPIPLPDIEMVDIGKEKGGASMAEASTRIFNTFYESIIRAVSSTTGVATDTLKSAGSRTMDAMGGLWDGAGNLIGKATDGVGNAVTGTKNAMEETVEKVKEKRKIRRAGRRSPLH